MKKILLALTAVLALTVARGQTNVSGGIYTNTTWTLANSPYIVTDTVVVFPGVTLTIQPGVTVKFKANQRLEIRQAKLIAVGTSTDSITFTSNSSTPSSGDWLGLFLNDDITPLINYCNFKYADKAIWRDVTSSNINITIKNSQFTQNNSCILYSPPYYTYMFVDSSIFRNNIIAIDFISKIIFVNHCVISNNQTGVDFAYSKIQNSIIDSNTTGIRYNLNDTIINCKIRYNNIGLRNPHNTSCCGNLITKNEIENNNIGIRLDIDGDVIYCNKICNNTTYDLYYNVTFGNNFNASNNYWCTPDSTSTSAVIYDGYDNINLGLVYFMPLDTTCSPGILTSINEIKNPTLSIFPNPFSTETTLQTDNRSHNATLTVDNCFGQTVAQIKNINGQTVTFHRDNLASGLYFIRLTEENKTIAVDKLVITDK
ncbi:MAG: T9SS type A sorting domain-containing protein [Bacteroidetes bacterium]|nr:T9SS type A sorting domain-containing protein [Bacteroidota bacterium]